MTDDSPVGAWDHRYANLTAPTPYGSTATYEQGALWLADCELVEDWGCGRGHMRTLVDPGRYRGIDGSASPFADEIVDLASYRSDVDGVFLRHVLEHNHRWADVLDNALASARRKLLVVLYTPLADKTHVVKVGRWVEVPVISFRLDDIAERIRDAGFRWRRRTVGHETMILCTRKVEGE